VISYTTRKETAALLPPTKGKWNWRNRSSVMCSQCKLPISIDGEIEYSGSDCFVTAVVRCVCRATGVASKHRRLAAKELLGAGLLGSIPKAAERYVAGLDGMQLELRRTAT
jgi:hypothetical protein